MKAATRSTKRIARRPQQPQMFMVPERNARVPDKLYKEISPQNHMARFTFFEAAGLLYQGKLTLTIREKNLVPIRANSSWLKCLDILEKHGMSYGVHYLDLADALELKPETTRGACLKAEKVIFDLYGFHVGFFSRDGIFKLATDAEVAEKALLVMKEVTAKAKRLGMYSGALSEFSEPLGTLQVQLFGPMELPRGETKPKHHPN